MHRLGITIGDFNGIGPELILKTLSNEMILSYCTPVVYGTKYVLDFYAKLLDIPKLDFNVVHKADHVVDGSINLRVCSKEKVDITPGEASEQAGRLAYAALELAVDDIKNGLIHNIVTAPIDKNTAASGGLEFNGHTNYFAKEFSSDVQMILLNDEIRVAMVTGHSPLEEVKEQLSSEKIHSATLALSDHLKSDFGIAKPKIAVLGLNPHSGDGGLIGTDEIDVIAPAIKLSQDENILAIGPFPPDGLFGSSNIENFDAVLGMYHDQVLTPFKQVAFDSGVNYTAGLPFIRTSPDHGTAYDIAGKGIASISSFVNAIYLVNKIHRNRLSYYDSSTSPLEFRDHRREKFSIGVPDLK